MPSPTPPPSYLPLFARPSPQWSGPPSLEEQALLRGDGVSALHIKLGLYVEMGFGHLQETDLRLETCVPSSYLNPLSNTPTVGLSYLQCTSPGMGSLIPTKEVDFIIRQANPFSSFNKGEILSYLR